MGMIMSMKAEHAPVGDSVANSIKSLLQDIKANPPETLEDKLEALCVRTPQAILVQGQEGASKSKLLSSLEEYATGNGLKVIRVGCRKRFTSPFGLVRDLIKQAQLLYPRKAAEIEQKYSAVLSEFKHKVFAPDDNGRITITTTKYISFTRIDEKIPGEATIGLIVHLINYLLEMIRDDKKTLLILIDEIEFADSWSISFLVHLVRRIKRQPVAVCVTCDPKAKARAGKITFLLKKGDFFKATLGQPEHPAAEKTKNLTAYATDRTPLKDMMKSRLRHLDFAQQLVVNYLSVLVSPVRVEELEQIILRDYPDVRVRQSVNMLERDGIIHSSGQDKESQYLTLSPDWQDFLYNSLPLSRRQQYHASIAKVLEKSISGVKVWVWDVGDKINAIYFHLMKSGDWLSLLEYGKAYYSCPVNTYLQHADDNFRELHALISVETDLGKAIKDQVGYQIASDTARRPRGQTKAKMVDCEKYLKRGIDAYNRASIYANLSVLYSNHKTEAAYQKAFEYCDRAYKEVERISDRDLSMHMTAIIHSSKALTHFRLKEARKAIELEQAALRLVGEAKVIPTHQVVSRLAILAGLAQIYEKLLGDYDAAKNIYQELIKHAREHNQAEEVAENLISLAKSLYNAKRYDEALVYFLQCIKMAEGNHKLLTASMYAHKAAGFCYRSFGDLENSTKSFQECLKLAVEAADLSEIASLAASIGLNYYKQQQLSRSSYYYSRALGISKQAKLKEHIPAYSARLGVLRANTNDYKNAAELFKGAAKSYFYSGRFENALKYYAASMACYTQNEKPCGRSLLQQVERATQISDGSVSKAVFEEFMKAYLEQAAILKQSGRTEYTDKMLYDFSEFARRY